MGHSLRDKTMIVYYHAACYDGFGSAFLYWLKYRNSATYVPVQYGEYDREEIVKQCINQDVAVVDFSFDRETMWDVIGVAESFICLDHHATAEKNLEGLPNCVFDMTKCGMRLTAEHLGIQHWLVDYIEDRDLWKWELPNSRKISAGLRTIPMEFEYWDEISKLGLIDSGIVLERYLQIKTAGAVANAQEMVLSGGEVLRTVNCTNGDIISDVAKELGSTFFVKGNDYVISLRGEGSRELAEKYGGGGHPTAAGFRQPRDQVTIRPLRESDNPA